MVSNKQYISSSTPVIDFLEEKQQQKNTAPVNKLRNSMTFKEKKVKTCYFSQPKKNKNKIKIFVPFDLYYSYYHKRQFPSWYYSDFQIHRSNTI